MRSASTRAQDTARTVIGGSRAVAVGYFVLAIVGLVGTWYYNLRFVGGDGGNYLQAWFANPASSSAAVDVIVTAVVACVFYLREGARLGRRWAAALIPLTFLVALAFTLPLFLGLRELRLARRQRAPGTDDTTFALTNDADTTRR